MTVTSLLTNITLAEGGDTGNWDDLGSGQGSSQNADLPIEGLETRARRVSGNIRGFGYDAGVGLDLSAAGTHVGFWVNVFQAGEIGATQGLQFCLSDSEGDAQSGNWDGHNFTAANYPVTGGWQRIWVSVARTRDAGGGTLSATTVRNFGCSFEMNSVGGNVPNCHLDRIDYGAAGIRIEDGTLGTPVKFADAITLDENNSLGVITGDFLNAPIIIGGAGATVFRDSNFALKAGPQVLSSGSTWQKIEIDNSAAATDVVLGGYFLESIPIVVNGTNATIDLGTGTFLNAPSMTWNSSVVYSGKIASSGVLVADDCNVSGAVFEEATGVSAVQFASLNTFSGKFDGCSFVSSGTGHAFEIGDVVPSPITLTDVTFENYAPTDGSTGNEAIWIRHSSGSFTINYNGDAPTIRTDGATVTLVNSINWTIEARDGGILVPGVEITVTDDADPPNELFHVESSVTGSEVYAFDGTLAGNNAVILIATSGADSFENESLDTVHPSGAQTTTIPLRADRVEDNP